MAVINRCFFLACRLQSRITESYPISCLLEPQLIPYSLSDVPLYSDNPDSSDTLATTLTEDVMLVSPADFYSLLKHLHCHPNNVIQHIGMSSVSSCYF